MAEIFLSYSHRDGAFVRNVADGLTAEGYSLWWDRLLTPATDFGKDIEQRLADSKCVVVVWSNTARDSFWVRAEASTALEQNKLIQIAAEPTRPPLPFNVLHLLDLSKWRGDRRSEDWRNLAQSCSSMISGPHQTLVTVNNVRASPASMLAPLIAVGAGSLGLVILAGALIALLVNSSGGDQLGPVTMVCFVIACLGLGFMLLRTVQIGLASRRPL